MKKKTEGSASIAEAVEFHQGLQESWIPEVLKRAGLKPVEAMVVALSFPTSGGEAVVPPLNKDGQPNYNAGEAKKRFQYIPKVATTDGGRLDPAMKTDVRMAFLTRGAKLAGDHNVLCLTPAKHNPWKGSTFGPGNDAVAEVAARIVSQLHGNIIASIINDPPDGIDLTKGGKVKLYNGHFERYAGKVGLRGKGFTTEDALTKEIMDLARTAPAGASITLDVQEKDAEKTTTSVTLRAADGTEFTISAKTSSGKKDKGKRSPLEMLRTQGPFTYVKDAAEAKVEAKKEDSPETVPGEENLAEEIGIEQ